MKFRLTENDRNSVYHSLNSVKTTDSQPKTTSILVKTLRKKTVAGIQSKTDKILRLSQFFLYFLFILFIRA
jgi:hypothetical protein